MPRLTKKNRFSQIGHNIKLVRVGYGWSPTDFATKMEVTARTVHDWENGRTDIPHSRVEQAAKIFNITTSNLETAHEKSFIHIQAQYDDQVVNNDGVIQMNREILDSYVQDLRLQIAQKDKRIAHLEQKVDDLLYKLFKK